MNVELRLFATFREVVGRKTVDREVPADATIETVLRDLESEYPDFEGAFVEDGAIPSQVNVLKNGRAVVHLEGLETPVEDGDAIAIFPPVAGG
ncbi:ubiquitin-like small modifier protein 1 [Halanaeroarchaeum sulfurireducens]|uniref:Molybdopterin converting factor subunit 1 n=1 Tax=Halanaeroarchaeum sulfurireducens TaxID=1604004 RepID=A0A0F7PGK1_9EURY|nr:ubiquitin-like small modifier protein 1 [Halanaeroarchaeum sulfurireducens]AKH98428.1 molybdopterin converting factor subunit 1 [Halanaeroarchaeum sulfurireducens]ALG82822.1 molybdopterin converting factor subunit 1 [Halanaeroarchaeum sulfurireducens]